jgi:hypothetical protein
VTAPTARGSEHETLGIARLGYGFDLAAYVLIVYQLTMFVIHLDNHPAIGLSTAAWCILLVTTVAAQTMRWRFGERVPVWAFYAVLATWALVVVLDVIGSWGTGPAAPTAAVAVGAALLLLVTLHGSRDILIAAVVLGVVLAVTLVIRGESDSYALGPAIVMLALAVAPPVLGVKLVRSMRVIVQLELDRAQVQSTVDAPRFAVGMLASEELARLDLDAERLLDGVATGRAPLPLDPKTASAAASLATELRLHLIEGRRETWLYHAVSESTFLGPVVTVTDPAGLAGLLSPQQRDGLLSAVWLLISDPVRQGQSQAQSLQLTISRSDRSTPNEPRARISIPITISATGVPRSRVDPAAWQAIRRVGRYAESSTGSALRIKIDCVVDNPADQ